MTDTTSQSAAFAWARLVDGAPVYEVFDWLREALSTDDVGAVKRALYEACAASVSELAESRPYSLKKDGGSYRIHLFADAIGSGYLDGVYKHMMDGDVLSRTFGRMWKYAHDSLSLCRQIEVL